MKKRWLVTIALILVFVLAACGGSTGEEEPNDVNEKSNKTTEKESDEATDEADEEEIDQDDEAVKEQEEETSIEKKPSEKEEESTDTDESEESSDTSSEDEEQSDDENTEKEGAEDEEDMIDLAFLAFDAQAEEDYDYLESILSEGSTLNKENNTIQFDNVTYPHEYEFLSKKDREFLTERYVQMKEEDRVLLGFEVTDYYDESSYVIDVVYLKENGEWKLNDMDINK